MDFYGYQVKLLLVCWLPFDQ